MKNLQLSKIHVKIKIKYENYHFKHIDFTIEFDFNIYCFIAALQQPYKVMKLPTHGFL